MLLSGCALCVSRSPVTSFRDLIRSMQTTARVLLARYPTEQLSVYPTYHAQRSSGFCCTNSRTFSLLTQHSCVKANIVHGQDTLSDLNTRSHNRLSYRFVYELVCRQQSNLLSTSNTGFQYSFLNISDQVKIPLRLYSTKEPNTFSTTDSKQETTADKQTITDLRHDKILTVPNVLTMLRMVMAPVLGYLVLEEAYSVACVVFVVAGLTDMLDGLIARNFKNQTSALGSFIDPLADKLLISILFVSLTAVNLLPVALTALVLVRDICLMSGGFYVRYISLDPRPKSLKEYFDITNPSARLQPTFISKVNTAVQLSVVALTLAAPVFGYVDHPAVQALWYLTAATTLGSGVGYIFAKDTFKLLQKSRKST